jgi:serine/threonine protein kinase
MIVNSPPTSAGQAQLATGTRLNGIYEIDRLIARGGMGEVYVGHVIETGDPVAVKVLLPEFCQNAAALTLFRKEASALHYVHDDAVIRYYVFAVEPVLARPYLAMEFVDGRSLSDILEADGALTFEAVRSLCQRLASGLQAAHDRGVIHRDISPDNVIVPSGDVARAKIIDFGIARSTQHGTVIGSGFAGKFNYVSPEQLGMFGGDVTAKSDIYSLALVLVNALTGQPMDMGGSQVEIVEKRRKIPDLGAIDMRIRPLLEKMLQPDPAGRVESMRAIAAWPLGGAPSGQNADPRWPGAATPASSKVESSGRRFWIPVTVLPLLALIAGAGAYYYYGAQAPVTPSVPPPKLDNGANLSPGTNAAATNPSPPAPAAAANPSPPTHAAAPSPIPLPSADVNNTVPGPSAVATNTGPTPPAQAAKPSPAIPAVSSRVEDIRHYLDRYDGGDCFYVSAVAISDNAAALEGFGASPAPFETLDADFHRTLGIEPDIGVRQVTQQQCPAISFLSRLRNDRTQAPRLDIDKATVRNGEVLTGMVDHFGDRNVDLILVSDSGTVQNLSQLLKPGTDAKTFKIGMQRNESGGGSGGGRQPQLLLAIASASPLASLRSGQAMAAAELFPNLVNEAAQTGQKLGASARYFMLEK